MRLGGDVDIGDGLAALGDRLRDGVHRILNGWAAGAALLASLHLAELVQVIPSVSRRPAVGAALGGVHQWPKS